MRSPNSLAPFVCGLATAVFAVATIFLAPELVQAQDNRTGKPAPGKVGPGKATPGKSMPGNTGPGNTGPGNTGSGNTGPGITGSGGSTCTCPDNHAPSLQLWPKPKFAGAHSPQSQSPQSVPGALDSRDETAVLEAVHLALTEVGDGSAYVWHGRSGRLSGVVSPTSSFKDTNGKICRHIVVALSADGYSRQTEGVACRLSTGTWQLEG